MGPSFESAPGPIGFRKAVHREDIDVDAMVDIEMGPGLADEGRVPVSDFGEKVPRDFGIIPSVMQREMRGQVGGGQLQEALEVPAGHGDIDIVVPGDEALVADGSQKGAIHRKIAQPVTLADVEKHLQDGELGGP